MQPQPQETCPVCNHPITQGTGMKINPKGHTFHMNCIALYPDAPIIIAERRRARMRLKYQKQTRPQPPNSGAGQAVQPQTQEANHADNQQP